MKSLRVAFVYQTLPATPVTGAHFYERNLINTLRSVPGVEVDIIAPVQPDSFVKKIFSPLKNLSLRSKLKNYDLIVFNSSKFLYFLPLLLLLRLKKKETMIIHHLFMADEVEGWRKILYRPAENMFLHFGNRILTPSQYLADIIKAKFKKESIICPVPFEAPVAEEFLNPQKGKLLFIGNIEPRKGLHLLIDALILIKTEADGVSSTAGNTNLSLDIIGKIIDREYYETLCQKIEAAGLDVKFHGFLNHSEQEEIKRKSYVFVFPSLLEGFGMALNEAHGYGLPVICFNNSAMPYSVKDKVDGILVEDGNVTEFAKAISMIVNDRELRNRLSVSALKHARILPGQTEFYSSVERGFIF